MNTSKLIGSTMIVIGTTVGAGMLAQPMVGAASGFTWSLLLMLVAWLSSTVAGLLVIEMNLALPSHACSYSAMAEQTLGNFGKIITWLSYLFLLYAIITAYMIGATNFISDTFAPMLNIEIPNFISATMFTITLGIAVFWSTMAVDHFNRVLITFKGLFLLAALVLIIPHIDLIKLAPAVTEHTSQINYLWRAVPTFVCAFGFHFVIPSLRIYLGEKPGQLKIAVIVGTTVALIIYLWWMAAALGTIPLTGENSFTSFAGSAEASNPSGFISFLASIVNNSWVTNSIIWFSNIALTTSFLGVALGLFDFLAEGFKRKNTRFGRLQTSFLTFIPPLLFAILYPQGFLVAIQYASIPLAILTLILPAMMVYNLRRKKELKSPYQVKCGNIAIGLIILVGAASVVLAIMYIFDMLPKL